MFSWIKKLSLSSRKDPASTQAPMQTRVVKRIIPASLRESEAAAPPPLPIPTVVAKPAEPRRLVPIAFPGGTPSIPMAMPAVPMVEPVQEEEPAPEPISVAPAPIKLASNSRAPRPVPAGAPASASKQIVLTIGDFVSKIPSHFINESAVHPNQEVHFEAADLYSDMTKGRATVPLSIIAENVPGLFKRRLSPEEDVEIQLPLPKIVAQMSEFLTRQDQEEAESYDEIDTPFRKAAQRDGEAHKKSGPIAPALPKPTPTPAVIKAPTATSIPQARAPQALPESFKPKLKPVSFQAAAPEAPAPAVMPSPSTTGRLGFQDDGRRVTVRVRPLIQALPMEQRERLLGSIPEDSQVDLPLTQIEEQLPSGRVVLPFSTFAAALKPDLRSTFTDHYTGDDVPISLSEIVRNLPRETLNRRTDQVIEEVDPNEFETPFNTTPSEIPKPPAVQPVAPSVSRAKPLITPSVHAPSVSYTTRKLAADTSFPSPMHAALMTHEALDAKKVVKLASALPGVAGMTVITSDGLSLASNLPAFMNPDGFTAMAPQMHRRTAALAADMKIGDLQHLTLYTDTHTVTIFTSGSLTLAVLHQNQADFGHGVREKLIAIIRELEKQYAPSR